MEGSWAYQRNQYRFVLHGDLIRCVLVRSPELLYIEDIYGIFGNGLNSIQIDAPVPFPNNQSQTSHLPLEPKFSQSFQNEVHSARCRLRRFFPCPAGFAGQRQCQAEPVPHS